MNYSEVKIFTTTYGIDAVTGALSDLGIDAFIVEDAHDFEMFLNNKKDYDWDYVDEKLMELMEIETCIIVYLDASQKGEAVADKIRCILAALKEGDEEGVFGRLLVETIAVSDDQWKDNWKEFFKPTKISQRIVIKPTWEPYEVTAQDEIVINIDPGMAFGTGTHETTTMCIKLLEKYVEPGVDDVLDIGCGSGILAIAATMLGARSSTGIDIDPIAIQVASDNIAINGLTTKIDVYQGDLTKEREILADIVVANLSADLIMTLASTIGNHLKNKKIFIASGILIDKQESVAEAIRESGFEIMELLNEGEWAAVCAKLHPSGLGQNSFSCNYKQ
jgi:ribosomal protein L11 methyltransferase